MQSAPEKMVHGETLEPLKTRSHSHRGAKDGSVPAARGHQGLLSPELVQCPFTFPRFHVAIEVVDGSVAPLGRVEPVRMRLTGRTFLDTRISWDGPLVPRPLRSLDVRPHSGAAGRSPEMALHKASVAIRPGRPRRGRKTGCGPSTTPRGESRRGAGPGRQLPAVKEKIR